MSSGGGGVDIRTSSTAVCFSTTRSELRRCDDSIAVGVVDDSHIKYCTLFASKDVSYGVMV